MKKWSEKIIYKLRVFMQGRYGYDRLSRFLLIAAVVIMLLSMSEPLRFLYFIALAILIWLTYRAMSRNIYKRRQEEEKYLKIIAKPKQEIKLIKRKWQDRKTHRYYKCPNCRMNMRITNPGKGRNISMTCPKCGTSFTKKT